MKEIGELKEIAGKLEAGLNRLPMGQAELLIIRAFRIIADALKALEKSRDPGPSPRN